MIGVTSQKEMARADLRTHDHDRYLAALFAPASVRDDLIALYAANAALERIGRSVTEPMLGEIRLQWWRDALREAKDGRLTGDPVADSFAQTILRRRLDPSRISDLVDARAFDIGGEAMPDMRALRTWLGKTDGTVFHLAARITAGEASAHFTRLADQAGLAYGIVQMMRRLPADREHGIDLAPQAEIAEIERAQGCARETAVRAVLKQLRDEASELAGPLLSKVSELEPGIRLAFMPLALAPSYLAAMERSDEWFRSPQEVSALARLWKLWRAS